MEVRQKLRNYIEEDEDLRPFSVFISDTILDRFMSHKKGDFHKACQAVRGYIDARSLDHGLIIITHLNPRTNEFFQRQHAKYLRSRDSQGRLVALCRFEPWDPDLYGSEYVLPTSVLYFDYILHRLGEENVPDKGIVCIFDLNGLSHKHIQLCTVSLVKCLLSLYINNFPLQPKAIHAPAAPMAFRMLCNCLKYLFKKKIRDRLYVSAGFDDLHKDVSPSILPESLGGELSDEEAFDDQVLSVMTAKEEFYQKFAQEVKRRHKVTDSS